MSTANIINNFKKVVTDMFSPFNTEEPLISEETQRILESEQGRNELFEKIIKNPKQGKVKVNVDGEDITYFVEA